MLLVFVHLVNGILDFILDGREIVLSLYLLVYDVSGGFECIICQLLRITLIKVVLT